jgi:hypothetical protein
VERVLPWLIPIIALPLLVFALDRFWSRSGTPGIEERIADFQPVAPRAVRPPDESLPEVESPPTGVDDNHRMTPDEATEDGSAEEAARTSSAESTEVASRATEETGGSLGATPPAGASGTPMPSPSRELGDESTEGEDQDSVADGPPSSPVVNSPGESDSQGAATPQATVQRIIIGASDATTPADAMVLNSLASACLEAASRGIETIELHFNETREERPFDIASQRLTIRNGVGFHPTIVFRPNVEDLSMDCGMIRIGGGQTDWQGVHLLLELPPEPADEWSLFDLEDIESLNVEDSVITVRNARDDGAHLQDRVAFFRLRSDRLPQSEESPESSESPIPPYIGLSDCVARGQGTLAWAPEATPFRIVCRQCLLVTSQRLIDVGGLRVMPDVMDGPIDAVLKNVTAVVGKGVCRLSSDDGAPYQLDLVTDCRDSIFVFADSNTPFIERRGVASIAEVEKHLFARGRDNFYLGAATLLRINPTGDSSNYVDFSFQEREEGWSQEQNPRFTLLWASKPPEGATADQQTAMDYRLDSSEQNPAIYDGGETRAGVDPTLLPAVPEDATRRDEAAPEPAEQEPT